MATVRHVVLVKFRETATEAQRQLFIDRSNWGRHAEYVSGYTCGWGVSDNPYASSATDAWDWGMTLDLDEADVQRYATDPIHREVGQAVQGIAEKYAILDFVME